MASSNGERQIGKDLTEIADNHISRYKWAVAMLQKYVAPGGHVLDAACGCAYGSKIIAEAGYKVTGYDKSEEAELYARNFAHPNVRFKRGNIFDALNDQYDAVVSIETIEHIPEDQEWINALYQVTPIIIATVPNEDVVPFNPKANVHHVKHYTKYQFEALLSSWTLSDWHTQDGKWEDHTMRPGFNSHTLGVVARR